MGMTAAAAAEAVGMTRQGIIKAIKTGKISAAKDGNGAWEVDPAELFRVYRPRNQLHSNPPEQVEAGIQARLQAAEREIELLRGIVEDRTAERDEWRKQAQTLAITDGRKNVWSWLRGR